MCFRGSIRCSYYRFLLCFFNDTATTEIYTLSLHDALPISRPAGRTGRPRTARAPDDEPDELPRRPPADRARAPLRLAARRCARGGDGAPDARVGAAHIARLGGADRRGARRRWHGRALEAPARRGARPGAAPRARHRGARAPAAGARARDRLRPGEPLPRPRPRRAHLPGRPGCRGRGCAAAGAARGAAARRGQARLRVAGQGREAPLLREAAARQAQPRGDRRRARRRGPRATAIPRTAQAARAEARPRAHVLGPRSGRRSQGTELPAAARRRPRLRPRRAQARRPARQAARARRGDARRAREAPELPRHAGGRAAATPPARPARGRRHRPARGRLERRPRARARAAAPARLRDRRPDPQQPGLVAGRGGEAATPVIRWSPPGPYQVVFSTREGGVSEGPYASLNLGRMTGDDVRLVDENRRILCAAIGAPVERLVQ